jgi:hypothetical protein
MKYLGQKFVPLANGSGINAALANMPKQNSCLIKTILRIADK